jgi:transposase
MGSAVAITRLDLSASQLRLAAAKEKDATAARRIPALALVLEGAERTTAARSCGMDRQMLRDWVHRYNREGLAGLRNRVSTGAPSRLTPAKKQELARVVEAGPERDVHGVVRWRRVDLRDEMKRRFGVERTSARPDASSSHQTKSPLDGRAGRTHEPHAQGGHGQEILLRQP